MIYDAKTFKEYLNMIPEDRREPLLKLVEVVEKNLPVGFEKNYADSFVQFNVPISLYPDGYHVNKGPLPFIGIASQKNFIGFYHLGIYAFEEISKWFSEEYPKYSDRKLDMGKSCIRLKNMNHIPYDLIGELCRKITPQMWIEKYEATIKK